MIWVALAGPAINFFQALAWLLAFYLMKGFDVTETYFLKMSLAGVVVNVSMFVFNLFPLPPLDGGRILVGLLPWRAAVWLSKVEAYGMYIVLALVAFNKLDDIWMGPLMKWTLFVLSLVLSPFEFLLNP
jgi:Zn-dependent protease